MPRPGTARRLTADARQRALKLTDNPAVDNPLANGLLTGKARRGQEIPAGTRLTEPRRAGFVTDAKLDKVEALIASGQEQGVSILEMAIGGLAAQPACSSVIAGATFPDQVKANAAAGEWEPTGEQLAAIDKIVPPPPTVR